MNIHNNARLAPRGREILVRRIVDNGLRVREAAQASGLSVRSGHKWLARYRAKGWTGLADRSSRPTTCPHRTPNESQQRIIKLRCQRWTYRQISQTLKVAHNTVGRVLRQAGLNRLSALEPVKASNRYVHDHPGDMLHLDIKKLGRFVRPGHRVTGNRRQDSPGAGWEYVHVAIDDHSRVALGSIHPDESGLSACRRLMVQSSTTTAHLCLAAPGPATDTGAVAQNALPRHISQIVLQWS